MDGVIDIDGVLEGVIDIVGNLIHRDPLLSHRVAVPDRDRLVNEAVVINSDAEGRAHFLVTAIALADRGRLVESALPSGSRRVA